MSSGNGRSFLDKIDLELKRAERYRVFVSLIVIDLKFVDQLQNVEGSSVIDDINNMVMENIRVIDDVAVVDKRKLALLLPETPRQGAEITALRLSEMIRKCLHEKTDRSINQVVPLEMVSFPDAAGARTIKDLIMEFSETNLN